VKKKKKPKDLIQSIDEVFNVKVDNYFGGYDGYKIKTLRNEWLVLINNGQDCCESWGYFSTPDDTSEFIGAELLRVQIIGVDEDKYELLNGEYRNTVFANFHTSIGVFQLAVYNAHNGYYGHNIFVLNNGHEQHSSVI